MTVFQSLFTFCQVNVHLHLLNVFYLSNRPHYLSVTSVLTYAWRCENTRKVCKAWVGGKSFQKILRVCSLDRNSLNNGVSVSLWCISQFCFLFTLNIVYLIESSNEGQFAFTVESIVMVQKLRGTLTYMIKVLYGNISCQGGWGDLVVEREEWASRGKTTWIILHGLTGLTSVGQR